MAAYIDNTRIQVNPEVFRNVYEKRMELHVTPERVPLIENLVANQIAGVKIINAILKIVKTVEGLDCHMKKPDLMCFPRYKMEGGGIIYRTRDGIPNSVLTKCGIIQFTSGWGGASDKNMKTLHDKLTAIFGLKKIKTVVSGLFGVNYTTEWFNITTVDFDDDTQFDNDVLNLSLTSDNIDHITLFNTRQEFVSDLERKVVDAGTLAEVSDLVAPFSFNFNRHV
jgi:hypothetical protein